MNPNVDAKTHKKITTGTYDNKFGIAFEKIVGVYARAAKLKHIRLRIKYVARSSAGEAFADAVRKVAPIWEN